MTGIYGNLTKYIDLFKNDIFGKWSKPKRLDDEYKTIIVPHVHYTTTVQSFIKDVYKFIDDEDVNIVQNKYDNIKKSIYNHEFEIENATSDEILYYLLWMVNSERFCDGLLLSHFEDGTIMECLKKLKSIDDKNISIYNQKMLKTALKGK